MPPALRIIGTHPDFPDCQVLCDGSAGFCHTQPYPTDTQLLEYYASEYREVRQEGPTPDYVRFMDHRAKAQMDFILQSSGTTRFSSALDIGCGAGRLVNTLAASATKVWGYEADTAMADFAQTYRAGNHIEIVNTLFQPEQFGNRAELITMSHVLEHVPHPETFLAALRENALASNGFLFIEVPNDPAHWVEKQIKWKLKGLAHLNYFTPASLIRTFNAASMKVVTLRVCGPPLSQLIRDRRPKSRLTQKITRAVHRMFPPTPVLPCYVSPLSDSYDPIYVQAVATPE